MSERNQAGDRTPVEYEPFSPNRFEASPSAELPGVPSTPPAPPYGSVYSLAPAYPPPPEYYLAPPPADALPPPPPQHAFAGAYPAYPAYAADGLPGQSTYASASVASPPYTAAGVSPSAPRPPSALGRVVRAILPPGSALVSFALYAAYGGWQFGLGLVLLLLIHEMGHFVVIRAKGLPAALPIFIPFLGAYVAMRRMPKSVRDEAEIALAGPLAGALGGGVCFVFAELLGGEDGKTLLFLAYFSFFINLLNLLPIAPLDGGHVVGAISRWLWPLGLLLLGAAYLYTFNLFLLALGVLFFSQTLARFRLSRREPYYAVGLGVRLYVSGLYVGLAVGLALALYVTQAMMPTLSLLGQ